MSGPSVLVLEADWVPNLDAAPSVRPFVDGWAAHRGLTLCHRSFGSRGELAHWLRHFLASDTLCVAYLAAHGREGCLHTPTSEIPLPELAREVARGRRNRRVGKGIIFGACQLGAHLAPFLVDTEQKFDWALGYTETIPWLGATVTDLLFLEYLFAGIELRPEGADACHFEAADAAAWLVSDHCQLAKLMGLSLTRAIAARRPARLSANRKCRQLARHSLHPTAADEAFHDAR